MYSMKRMELTWVDVRDPNVWRSGSFGNRTTMQAHKYGHCYDKDSTCMKYLSFSRTFVFESGTNIRFRKYRYQNNNFLS